MKTKFTKGKWEVQGGSDPNGYFIRAVVKEEEIMPNIQLIEAAPELLEACIAAKEYVDQWTSTAGKELSKILGDAIKKATAD